MSPAQFIDILEELQFQESVDEWRKQYSLALLMATIYNTIPRKKGSRSSKAKDFLESEMPTRNRVEKKTIEQMAKDKGIKLPKER